MGYQAGNEHSCSPTPRVPETTRTCHPTSNQAVKFLRSHNLNADEDREGRGIKKQKYPLDDYLIDANTQTLAPAALLAPISPVSSPETVDVLQSAERLVKSAQKQITELSLNSTLNTLDENPGRYTGKQSLDDSLLYVRELVDFKFQESNEPDGTYIRKAARSNVPSSNRKLHDDQFPVKESNSMLYKPLEISEQNSEFSTSQVVRGTVFHNERPFFKKAPNWFEIKPPKHITVFPTSTMNNLKSKTKSSRTAQRCTVTNTGVIEIESRDRPAGTIQVQTGPTVDIRRGLRIQTIENVHISPDPSSIPVYNNIGTYCFQHEPSPNSSFADSNGTNMDRHGIVTSSAKNVDDREKERHIQSMDYNESGNTVIKASINPSHDTIGTQAIPTDNGNNDNSNVDNIDHLNRNELDSEFRSQVSRQSILMNSSSLHKSSICNENLRAQKMIGESLDDVKAGARVKKSVSISLTPIKNFVSEEFLLTDVEGKPEDKEQNFETKSLSKDDDEISSNSEFPTFYGGTKFRYVRSDKNYVQSSRTCDIECKTGSCSKKCERDVEHKEKLKLKEALNTIANIEKRRFDLKDTGIVPTECTQICKEKNYCIADAVSLEFEQLSDPDSFKTALANLCKSRQNTKTFKTDINSATYEEAIDAFVKTLFASNCQSSSAHKLDSPGQNLENENTLPTPNEQSIEGSCSNKKPEIQMKAEEAIEVQKPELLISNPKRLEFRHRTSTIVRPKINNAPINNSSTIKKNAPGTSMPQFYKSRLKESNNYAKPPTPRPGPLSEDKAFARQEKSSSEMISNEEESSLGSLNLKQPCVSDVDAILRIYRKSMAAICHGTEQLSQLISHHVMKNGLSTSDQIASPPIPNCTPILGKSDITLRNTACKKTFTPPVMSSVASSSNKIKRLSDSEYEQDSAHESCIKTVSSDRKQATEVKQQRGGESKMLQHEVDPRVSRDDAGFSNENNSVCTNRTVHSATNEYSSVFSGSSSEHGKTSSNNEDKSSRAQCNVTDETSNSTATSKVNQQAPVNIKNQSAPSQPRAAKSGRKSSGNQFMNVQYCLNEPFDAMIPNEATSDKKNSLSRSDLENPLSTYLHLENACGKDMRLHRLSNYDIHSDQTGDLNLYKCPMLVSGHRDNFGASNNNFNDEPAAAEAVVRTKYLELETNEVFGQILDAVRNSSQFTEQFFVSLFNGMEINSVNDIVRNLEDAAVHPIVIQQFLLILKERRNRAKSSFGGNFMLINPDDYQKNYNEPIDSGKNNDNVNNFEHSVAFNRSMETTNIHINKGDKVPAEFHPADGQITECADQTHLEMNLNFGFNQDCADSSHNHNSQDLGDLENKLSIGLVQSEMTPEKPINESRKSRDNLAVSKTDNQSSSFEPSLILPSSSIRVSALENDDRNNLQHDRQEVKETSQEAECCQPNDATSKEQRISEECLRNSISSNTTPKKNDSESNTDKDISFVIPHDAEINNEVVDLSSAQKLTSVTLKNESTGEIIGFQIESNCQNCLRFNSLTQESSVKIKSNSDPGQSSVANNKSNGKLKNANVPTIHHPNSTKNLQSDDGDIVCRCQTSSNHEDSKLESLHVPCQSSLDAVNARIDSQIQSNFKQLGLIDSEKEEKADHHIPLNGKISNKRARPSKLSTSSKSHARKATAPNQSGGKKTKSFDKKVRGNRKVSRINKHDSAKGARNAESSDSEKSDSKYVCPLCIKLQGKCSCLDCANCIINSKGYKVASPKTIKERAKFNKNISSPHQNRSPKRPGHITGQYLSRFTPAPLESGRNVNDKSNVKPMSARSEKNAALITRKSKLKPNVGAFGRNSNKNNGDMTDRIKLTEDNKLLQDAASDSDNLKVEEESQCEIEYADINMCKSTETQAMKISDRITVCKSSETLCDKLTTLDKAGVASPRKLYRIAESNTVDKPSVKEVGTVQCFENVSSIKNSFTDSRNNYCGRMSTTNNGITKCTETKDFSTMECQASESCNDFQKYRPNKMKTTSEAGTVSLSETMCPNIFDNESIIILQPLNELDHTFFIAKPNSAERKIIQERLNGSFNAQVKQITDHNYPSVHCETNEKLISCNEEIVEHVNDPGEGSSRVTMQLNNTTNAISCVKNKECQVDYPGGRGMENSTSHKQSNVAFAPRYKTDCNVKFSMHKDECVGLCINDEECLMICNQSLQELDDSRFQCKQDCPNEEICLKLCPPIPEVETSLQTNSLNINEILKKFIAEKGLLREFEDSLEAYQKEKLGTIYEKSESQNSQVKTEMKNAGKPVEGAKPTRGHQRSVQYDEPREKMKHIMTNRKSLNLPNVVRGIADMNPSTKLERLKLRTADPLVSGSFNKSQSDKRYSVFNQPDAGSSSIDLGDPKTMAHLACVAQRAIVQEGEESSSDSSVDIIQTTLMKIAKKPPSGKSSNNNASKLKKSRRGLDGDSRLPGALNQRSGEHDNNSMKSFESSDLEPGEFLQVRTPMDIRFSSEFEELSRGQAKYNNFCYNHENPSQSDKNVSSIKTYEGTKFQHKTHGNDHELCLDSAEAIHTRKKNRNNYNETVNKPESVSPDPVKSIANGAQLIFDKSQSGFGIQGHESVHHKAKHSKHSTAHASQSKNQSIYAPKNDINLEAKNFVSIRNLSSTGAKSNTLIVMGRHTTTDDNTKFSKMNTNHSSEVGEDSHRIINENRNTEDLHKYSDQLFSNTECSDRPQIINHFLGKTKLEDIKLSYSNNKSNAIFKEYKSFISNCQRLHLKSDFTSKTIPNLQNSNVTKSDNDAAELNMNSRTCNETYFANSNRITSKRWDQTSSDTYSEGEINLPSSCSYSLGEVKISTHSSTTVGRSFKDPDGLTIFVTHSILDSTHATCTSPGELLAEIRRTETDFSSSIS